MVDENKTLGSRIDHEIATANQEVNNLRQELLSTNKRLTAYSDDQKTTLSDDQKTVNSDDKKSSPTDDIKQSSDEDKEKKLSNGETVPEKTDAVKEETTATIKGDRTSGK